MMEELEHMEGPDQVLVSNDLSTTKVENAIKIRFGETEQSKMKPQSIPGLLAETSARFADSPALCYKKNPDQKGFETITFREYHDQTRTVAKAFLKLGLKKYHAVGILGFNSPEWFLSYLGAIFAGGIGTGIYTTNSAEATFHCLESSRTIIAVVEDQQQLDKVLQVKDKLPHLKVIVQYSGKPTTKDVMSWEELLAIGKKESDTELDNALKRVAINQCCSIIYTSGTVGNAKAVMLNHDNLLWSSKAYVSCVNLESGNEAIISYLPLSHVAAQTLDIFGHMVVGGTCYFANKDALKGGLIKSLLEVQPTVFLAVPRVWEKIAEKMKAIGAQSGMVKKMIATWAKSHGLQRHLALMEGIDSPSFGYLTARTLIFSKIKKNLGFERCKLFYSGAAPLAEDVKMYFASLDIPIMEAFGMSELSGAATINIDTAFKFNSIGRPLPGSRCKIESPNSERQGEICILGRHIFMGYYNDQKQTEETLDSEGWLRTGDIGKLDEEGFIYITGRIKELIITAGGENVAPMPIEFNVKAALPFLGNAVLIGEKKKFLSILLSISSEFDTETGQPTDELSEVSKLWLSGIGLPFHTLTEFFASGPDKAILASIQKGIDDANKKAVSHAQNIQKFAILPKDFSIPTGEYGPTLKIKRNVVSQKYKEVIDKLYEE